MLLNTLKSGYEYDFSLPCRRLSNIICYNNIVPILFENLVYHATVQNYDSNKFNMAVKRFKCSYVVWNVLQTVQTVLYQLFSLPKLNNIQRSHLIGSLWVPLFVNQSACLVYFLFSALNFLFSALNYPFSASCSLKTAFFLANQNREIFSSILLHVLQLWFTIFRFTKCFCYAAEHNKDEVLEGKFCNLNFSPSTKQTTEYSFELFLYIYRY